MDKIGQIKKTTEGFSSLIVWLANDVVRGPAIKRFAFALAVLVSCCNPLSAALILAPFSIQLPSWYTPFFWTLTLLLAGTSIFVAARTTRHAKADAPAPTAVIRGLIAFTSRQEDVRLFAKLQREREIGEILTGVSDPQFQIGYISGDSGSGKSSIVQAGIAARIEIYHSIVVELTDLDPIESIKTALLPLTGPLEPAENLPDLFIKANQLIGKPILLILDQFEQFFVHNGRRQDRRRFIESLKIWFVSRPKIPGKILICIRGDFADRLVEIQKALNYTLGPNQVFRVERFQPEQAVAIFQTLAEAANMEFNEPFIRSMVLTDLASRDDGTVSPVDIQMLSWVIVRQADVKQWAFTKDSVSKSGGVEGLLEHYLRKTFDAEPSFREPGIKVLLALMDLNQNARAGALTINDVSTRLNGKIPTKLLVSVLDWLARSDIRLVTQVSRNNQPAYQIVHERLIPAVKKVAFGVLAEADKANEILNRRAREWLDNGKSKRYLLTWPEWRMISRQRSTIEWGEKQRQKQELLSLTAARWRTRGIMVGAFLLSTVLAVALYYSHFGQVEITRLELESYLKSYIPDSQRSLIVTELVKSPLSIDLAKEAAEGIMTPDSHASALDEVAVSFAKHKKTTQASLIFAEVREYIAHMPMPPATVTEAHPTVLDLDRMKEDASSHLALELAEACLTTDDPTLCEQSYQATQNDLKPDPVQFAILAAHFTKTKDDNRAHDLLAKTQQTADAYSGSAFDDLTVRFSLTLAQICFYQADHPCEQVLQIIHSVKNHGTQAWLLDGLVASFADHCVEAKEIVWCNQGRELSDAIADPVFFRTIGKLALSYAKMHHPSEAHVLFKKAQDIVNFQNGAFDESIGVPGQFIEIAEMLAQAGDMESSNTLTEIALREANALDRYWRARSKIDDIFLSLIRMNQKAQAEILLKQCVTEIDNMSDPIKKYELLADAAYAYEKTGNQKEAKILYEQAIHVIETINDLSSKQKAYFTMASAYARIGDRTQAKAVFDRALQMHDVSFSQAEYQTIAIHEITGALAALGYVRSARQLSKQVGEDALVLAIILQHAYRGPSTVNEEGPMSDYY